MQNEDVIVMLKNTRTFFFFTQKATGSSLFSFLNKLSCNGEIDEWMQMYK